MHAVGWHLNFKQIVPNPDRACYFTLLSSQVHDGEHDKTSEFHGSEPIVFLFAKKYFLFGSDIVRVIRVIGKLFCKFMNSSSNRTAGSKGISIPGICVLVCNDKMLPLLDGRVSM